MCKSSSLSSTMKFWQDHLKGKVMLKVFCNWKGIMHHKFIPECAVVNKERYTEMLTYLQSQFTRSILKC